MSSEDNRRIRTAVIGFGTSGHYFHAPFIERSPEFELAAVVTSSTDRSAQVRNEYPNTEIIAGADELFARAREFDLVIVGSPPETHATLATETLASGLDVIVDKPFTTTSDEGRDLIAAARDAGRRLTVFQNRRRDGDFLTLKSLLQSGRLTGVSRFESRFEVYNPAPRHSWKTATRMTNGGGVLFDIGSHLIDQAIELFGPLEVSAAPYIELASRRKGAVAPDDAFVALRHATGTISHLWMNTLAAQVGPRYRVLTPTSGYTSWGLDPQEAQLKSGKRPGDVGFAEIAPQNYGVLGTDAVSEPVPTLAGDYAGYYEAVADWILRDGPAPVDPEDAVAVIALIERLHTVAVP
ncbi:Gfo/Idh/MocA family oxidoreductase [Spelaeicoccus albus]|uniref:Putative dehydrogenase n=1 Tax=Spelaeicoccus albus TaxID=1280376 RepID=A0A7Z0IH17_9MICO|nr:Gfo/Idh/MocA family oxidoreductase [Spelaeicoccus albus]NYI67490.1 putative dehydrogenase [Spelaeicoccus albus]